MAEILTLTATLEQRGPAGAFVLSDEQAAAAGDGRKAFPVRVTVNGVTLSLRVARMGGENLIGLAKAAREQAGVSVGSAYEIEVAADAGERAVDVPEELATALAADAGARAAFDALAFSHRKEFARWVGEAKREATRAQRVARTVEMLHAGEHR
ncbi:YdeI/OmpD-associated family protein [Symbioplanes lichenis]|uniref:YdeI/OmpD-associated family protein n=1 Tax=Symbioplanes lichenis TaxID=1629072 RepID=UPI0027390AE6|nr:YdeI/OmpD-associated family protein [Actinoplanes lichenis]